MIRVLLADDQALVRDGLRLLLELQGGFQVEAVAGGEEALAAVRRGRFHVALLDVRMPGMDGIACVRAIRQVEPDLPVLMLTTYDDDRLVRECLAAGAAAYLLKDMAPEDLANAIRLVVSGGTLIPGDLARNLLFASTPASSRTHGEDPAPEPLTPRQREVLQWLAAGLSNREIAARLFLSEGTVKNVVSEIYARLRVRDRVQAVLRARGMFEPEGPRP
ncbi:MAG: response regulator transcription factor [Firmicutes bacterium]|nr:response regulator transcription factor [Bacillota bacterium]